MTWLERIGDRRGWRKYLAAIGVSSALSFGVCVDARAQSMEKVLGTIESLTTAPRGEVDGAMLDDGTQLHWPPHLEDQFKAAIAVGERVEATGRTETAPRGEVHFEVARLTNLRTNATVENEDRGPPRGRPRRGPQTQNRDAESARGVVRSLTTAPRGEVDGAILDDGTQLHWPPHLEDQFKTAIAVGDRVEATGRTETAPRGEVHFEVARLTNLRTNATVENEDRGPPRGRPRRGPRLEDRQAATVRGVVRSLTTAPRGEIDGAVLEDGTVLHWPPHLQNQFKDVAALGGRVVATGNYESDPRRDRHFEVVNLTNLPSEASSGIDRAEVVQARDKAGRDERLQVLEEQLRQIQREIDRLRNEK